ncbi:hypothetical protein FHS78_001203 [Parvibaculum indicum]|uniref:DUF4089 domain-containing protein n=1 Tax=Parvibaculum indicum TaxID=562969 RepID=UPI0019658443|nr:DUF4089 domain-containing protein [Parvibaculum indicum]NIJ40927.1 hypothetical protein [Parvibaculum indicum]
MSLDRYLDDAAAMIGLEIPSEYRDEVLVNLERIEAIAALLLDCPPAAQCDEAASVFCPGDVE